ncbi:E3 ubiquitin-protein ligase rnf8-like isoform X1 [Haliotis rufescens]|uniref:E3 ubiquitin-protein ligase rnf8-like isoform X1 n=1 Tax=Haliotis rufescens TaxID=6454 RepID=UPI00201FA5CD|nr:E3 ubiquitin-protein ligase rnf8-like isoform X1 [Haliotis rufescens]
MFSFKRKSLVKVLLVSDREDIVDRLATMCAYTSSVKGGRQFSQPSSLNAKSKSRLGGGTDSSWSSLKRKNGDRSDSNRNSDYNGTCDGGMVLCSGRQLPPRPQSKGQPPCPKGNGKGKITTTKRNPSSSGRPDSRTSHSGSGNSHVEREYSHRERRTLYDQDVQMENLKTRPERTRGGRNHHVGRGNSYSGSGYSHSGRSTWYDQGDAQEEEHDLKTRPDRTQGSELKRANKAQHNDEDDDENVVKQRRLAPQRRNYEDEDDDEINDDDDEEEEEEDTSEQENIWGHVCGRIENQEQPRRELATISNESATVSAPIPRPSSPEDEMKEQLSCPVCLDLFTDPVILPCCHSLCSECAETIRSPKSSFKCPMCLAVVQNGPLQRNFHLEGTVSHQELSTNKNDIQIEMQISMVKQGLLSVFTNKHGDRVRINHRESGETTGIVAIIIKRIV